MQGASGLGGGGNQAVKIIARRLGLVLFSLFKQLYASSEGSRVHVELVLLVALWYFASELARQLQERDIA